MSSNERTFTVISFMVPFYSTIVFYAIVLSEWGGPPVTGSFSDIPTLQKLPQDFPTEAEIAGQEGRLLCNLPHKSGIRKCGHG